MSWDFAGGREVTIAPSAIETVRFGHDVERLTVGHSWAQCYSRAQLGERLRGFLEGSTATTVILRYPSEALFVPQELGDHGRSVYPAGALLYWEHVGSVPPRPPDVDVHQFPGITTDVVGQLLDVIADSFAGYLNHYAANPLIDEEATTEGYLEWAESTILDPQSRVFVLSVDGRPAGIATVECPEDGSPWEIQLAGMSSSAQGKGLYSRLVSAVLATAHECDVPKVVISTQAHNSRVQRTWARLGFVPFASIDTAHLVRPDF